MIQSNKDDQALPATFTPGIYDVICARGKKLKVIVATNYIAV